MHLRTSLIITLLLAFTGLRSQNINYDGDISGITLEDRVYEQNVKTVTLKTNHNPYAPSIIKLNSNEKLTLDFDLLFEDYKYLNYTIMKTTTL